MFKDFDYDSLDSFTQGLVIGALFMLMVVLTITAPLLPPDVTHTTQARSN